MYPIILSQFVTSFDSTAPFIAIPGRIIDFEHSLAISFSIWQNPPPPWVQKGITVLLFLTLNSLYFGKANNKQLVYYPYMLSPSIKLCSALTSYLFFSNYTKSQCFYKVFQDEKIVYKRACHLAKYT